MHQHQRVSNAVTREHFQMTSPLTAPITHLFMIKHTALTATHHVVWAHTFTLPASSCTACTHPCGFDALPHSFPMLAHTLVNPCSQGPVKMVVSGSPLCDPGSSHTPECLGGPSPSPRQVWDHLQEQPQGKPLTSRPACGAHFKAQLGATDALPGPIASPPRLQPGFGITLPLTI